MFSADLPPGFHADPIDLRQSMRLLAFQHRIDPDTGRCRSCDRPPAAGARLCWVAKIARDRLVTGWGTG